MNAVLFLMKRPQRAALFLTPLRVLCCLVWVIAAAANSSARAQDAFRDQVVPFVNEYCVQCHNSKKSEGELNLTKYKSVESLGEFYRQWEHVIGFVGKGEMPPAKAKQPSKELRAKLLATIQQLLDQEARKLAGDPGVVLPRRLSNAEYDYTIRDLTGVDIQPAKSFPVDPASGEGFNNTGEALRMSPSLFKKYYAAAEQVADHLLIKPSGFEFAPYSVVTYADQKKFYETAIISFYERHGVNYQTYLESAWAWANRPTSAQSQTLEQWAASHELSPRYMRRLWDTLEQNSADTFYLGDLCRRWAKVRQETETNRAVQGIRSIVSDIKKLSQELCQKETRAIVSNAGNPPIVHTDRRNQTARERDQFNSEVVSASSQISQEFRDLDKRPSIDLFLSVTTSDGSDAFVSLSEMNFSTQQPQGYRANDAKKNTSLLETLKSHAAGQVAKLKLGQHPLGSTIDKESTVLRTGELLKLTIPTKAFGDKKRIFFHAKSTLDRQHSKGGIGRLALFDQQPTKEDLAKQTQLVNPDHPVAEKIRKSGRTFCALFPNRFLYVDGTRGLSAGFHLIEGFFRDDQPLCKLVLDQQQNEELNRLWNELHFGTGIAEKLLRGFVFFERSERNFMKHADFDSIKEEDPALVEDATLSRFRDIYLQRSNVKATGDELKQHPVYVFFETIRTGLKQQTEQLENAKSTYLRQLEQFARRAYRRRLTDQELTQLRSFYEDTASQPEYGVDQALRSSIIRLLVSPHFCYRTVTAPAGDTVEPLPDAALASRLSYFLWSSTPDADLLSLAEAGELHKPQQLKKQIQRMLQDPKTSSFALEFFGQWLGYRDFLEQESVNRTVFRDFDDALKQSMFEEPTRVVTDLIKRDQPVIELLSSDATLVNARLAKHYGIPFSQPMRQSKRSGETASELWSRVDGMRQKGRGGLLGMAVFLTKFSQPERTSPVKRGFWVFHKVLGQHIPAPPDDVAVLPAKETDTNGKTIRELLKLHTDDAKCARCHQRFDPIGLSMEGFDPIGKTRNRDLAGRTVDNVVHLPNGKEARGVAEFGQFLAVERRDEFVETLCRKFLGYALGRSLVLSDQPLLEKMENELKRSDFRFSSLFETVVLSHQFLNQRCRDFSIARFRAESGDKK